MKADRHITRRSIARAMIFFVAFSQVATNAHAATDIADVPMAVKNKVPPNIIYVLDDSGSMDSEVLMPTNDGALWWHTGNKSFVGLDNADATAAGVINFNRAGEANATWKKYVSLFPNGFGGSGSGIRVYQDSTNDHFAVPPTAAFAWVRSSDYNALYYNPTITYAPWQPSHDGTNPHTYSNADPARAKSHPLLGTAETNLTASISSNTENWTFRMWPGMVAPAGASYRVNGGGGWTLLAADDTVPAGVYWDVQISYYPATYYLRDAAGTFLGPDGATLARYEIKPGNSFPSGRSYRGRNAKLCQLVSVLQKAASDAQRFDRSIPRRLEQPSRRHVHRSTIAPLSRCTISAQRATPPTNAGCSIVSTPRRATVEPRPATLSTMREGNLGGPTQGLRFSESASSTPPSS